MLEVRARDAWGRVAEWEVKGEKLTTPYLFPVVDPRKQVLSPGEIKKLGFPAVITNSYLIRQNEELREDALERGVHWLLGFDGIVMTDSGSYQLSRYGIDTRSEEILDFQEKIGTDIGVILDIPTPPNASRERAERELEETLRRAQEGRAMVKRMLLAGTCQGSTFPELRKRASEEMASLGFDLYPIGGVVPLLESYSFAKVVEIVQSSRPSLPYSRPVHLFGAGHPMFFSLAAALGCDLFDSAAYALYAREGRYITGMGTEKLEELRELPCSCYVCSSTSAKELRRMGGVERTRLLAEHNLIASREEIERVRQSIHEGSLWELAASRARGHPYLLGALRKALAYPELERLEPVTKKSAFFYTGSEALLRPEVKAHLARLQRLDVDKELVLLPEVEKPFSRSYGLESSERYHVAVASSVFGLIPLELEEVYPLSQHESIAEPEEAQLSFVREVVRSYASKFDRVHIHEGLHFLELGGEVFSEPEHFAAKPDLEGKLAAIGDYQFGRGAGKLLFSRAEPRISRTGRIREVYSQGKLVAVIRAGDGMAVLHREGAERLLRLPFPKNRVVASEDAVEFVARGRSLFCSFVESLDREIRPNQEVVVVDGDDRAVATGRATVSAEEMLGLERGMAVKVRHGLGEP